MSAGLNSASADELQIGYFAGVFAAGGAASRAGLPGWSRTLLAAQKLDLPPWATRPDFDLLAHGAAFRAAFVRGYFDRAGRVSDPGNSDLRAVLLRPRTPWFEEALVAALGGAVSSGPGSASGPLSRSDRRISWRGAAALDLLGRLYGELASAPAGEVVLARPKHLRRYHAWCTAIAGLTLPRQEPLALRVTRLDPSAALPSKVRISDSGYDLLLIAERKRFGQVVLYGTGLAVEPPSGWYFDVVARSSLIKTGYIVANSVGVIDRAYRGEILVPLLKVDATMPDLKLPIRAVQLVPRPIVHFSVVDAALLSTTERGALGFGSSG